MHLLYYIYIYIYICKKYIFDHVFLYIHVLETFIYDLLIQKAFSLCIERCRRRQTFSAANQETEMKRPYVSSGTLDSQLRRWLLDAARKTLAPWIWLHRRHGQIGNPNTPKLIPIKKNTSPNMWGLLKTNIYIYILSKTSYIYIYIERERERERLNLYIHEYINIDPPTSQA